MSVPPRHPWWAEASHPIWPILHTVAATLCFTLALAVTSSSFDATELKAIGGGGVLSGALSYVFKGN